MVEIFIIFLIIILLFAVVIGIAVALRGQRGRGDFDSQYLDDDGDHIYYDRRLIEKKEFLRQHPDARPRTFRQLFSKKNNKIN